MTTITIAVLAQILAGNMGELESHADALAEFTRKTWRADLADLAEAGHEINININIDIDIDVQHRASGCSRAVEVWCDDSKLKQAAELALTDEARIWELFCQSEEARR